MLERLDFFAHPWDDVFMGPFSNIIVRMPNWIGDLVMALPALVSLREAFPHSKLTAMVVNPLGELLEKDPHIDELFCFDKPKGMSRRSDKRDIVEKIAQGKYDLGILLTNSLSSAWWFWQGKVRERIGYATQGRSLLLTKKVEMTETVTRQHLTKTYQEILAPLGIAYHKRAPKLYLTQEEILEARQALMHFGAASDKPLIGINPTAAYGPSKCWLPERFREVALKMLEKSSATLLFFGDVESAPLVREICSGLCERAINLAGLTSLRELMAFIYLCDVLLTNDSGPMHMGAALSTEIVALFGSTDEVVTGPYQGRVLHKKVDCSPCFKKQCPIDFRCMKAITTDETVDILLKMIRDESFKSKTL